MSNVRPMKFRIEYIAHGERPAFLFARQLDSGEFQVSPSSQLGEVPIEPHLSCPRVLTPGGEPDLSVFTFTLVTANDLPKLQVGQIVELSSESK